MFNNTKSESPTDIYILSEGRSGYRDAPYLKLTV